MTKQHERTIIIAHEGALSPSSDTTHNVYTMPNSPMGPFQGNTMRTHHPATLYQDTERTITVDANILSITNHQQGRAITVDLEQASLNDILPPGVADLLYTRGGTPGDYYTLYEGNTPQAVLPQGTRAIVTRAIQEAQDARRTRLADPSSSERQKVEGLFRRAERLHEEPGCYFPALRQAQLALEVWRLTYPDAAQAEIRAMHLAQAEALEDQARDSGWYDADGGLSTEDQAERAAVLRARAQALRDHTR